MTRNATAHLLPFRSVINMSADDVLADVDMDAPTHAGSGSGGEAIHTAGAAARKGRGRGAPEDPDAEERYAGRGGVFDSLVTEDGAGPLKCKSSLS